MNDKVMNLVNDIQFSRCYVSSSCKYCKGAAGHGRLPVLHRANELCKRAEEKLDWRNGL